MIHTKNTPKYDSPDPWDETLTPKQEKVSVSWQFPLDPHHEIGATPTAHVFFTPEPHHETLQAASPKVVSRDSSSVILEDEMRVDAQQSPGFWAKMRDLLALLWMKPSGEAS